MQVLRISILPLSLILLFFEVTLFSFNVATSILYPICIITINLYLFRKYKNNSYFSFLFFLMFWVNYSVVILQFNFIQNSYDGLYSSLNGSDIALIGMRILFYFMLITLVLSETIKPKRNQFVRSISWNQNTDVIASFLIIIFCIISLDFVIGLDFFSKSIYEYSMIFLIFAIVMTKQRNQLLHLIIIMIGLLAVIGNGISGDRIVGLQFALILYLTYFKFKIRKRYVFLIGILGILFLTYTGANRENFSIADIQGMISSSSVLFDRMLTLDTSFSAYFTSLRSIEFMQELNFLDRLMFFVHFLGSLVAGSLYPYEEANIAVYTHSLGYVHSYGTFLPLLAYFYLGYFGLIVISYLLVRFLNRQSLANNFLAEVFIVYFCATFFRWYLYSPVMLLRGLFFISIIYLIIRPFVHFESYSKGA